jgi:hypothetical protein
MSAAQELFSSFFEKSTYSQAAVLFAASFDGKTRVPDGFGMCKRFAKVF